MSCLEHVGIDNLGKQNTQMGAIVVADMFHYWFRKGRCLW